jgi:hypothetical protein
MPGPDLPIIVESDTSNLRTSSPVSSHSSNGFKNRLRSLRWPQIVIILAGVIIVGEIIFGIKTFTSPPPTSSVGQVHPLTEANISLVSPDIFYKVGNTFPVSIRVGTGGHTINGVDVVLKYDPKVIQANDKTFAPKNVFALFPAVEVDNNAGIVRISGIADVNQPGFNSVGTLGKIDFTAKALGKTSIQIESQPGVTTESNVIESGTSADILGKTSGLEITVGEK